MKQGGPYACGKKKEIPHRKMSPTSNQRKAYVRRVREMRRATTSILRKSITGQSEEKRENLKSKNQIPKMSCSRKRNVKKYSPNMAKEWQKSSHENEIREVEERSEKVRTEKMTEKKKCSSRKKEKR